MTFRRDLARLLRGIANQLDPPTLLVVDLTEYMAAVNADLMLRVADIAERN